MKPPIKCLNNHCPSKELCSRYTEERKGIWFYPERGLDRCGHFIEKKSGEHIVLGNTD